MNYEIKLKTKYFSLLKHQTSKNALKRLMISQYILELYKAAYKKGKKNFEK